MTRHVVITGVTSTENRGVEALVASITAQLRALAPCRVTVLTQTPVLDRAALSPLDVTCTADPFVVSNSWRESGPPRTTDQSDVCAEAVMADADLVIATGGDLYTSDYGVSTAYLLALAVAQRRGVPVAMLAQSVGPFSQTEDAHNWVRVAKRCDVLTTRESRTHRYVVEELGLSAAKARLTADPAFLLPMSPAGRIREILRAAGMEPDQQYICVAPSEGITRFRDLKPEEHDRSIALLVRHLAFSWQVPVLLIPHVHDSRPHNDDRLLLERLTATGHANVRPVLGPLTASEYKGLVAGAILVIAERLHAAISALSAAVPTAAIGYSQKFLGVFADTYGDTIPLDRVHLDVETFVTEPMAGVRLLDSLDLPEMKRLLAARVPTILDLARTNFRLYCSTCGWRGCGMGASG